MGKSVSIEMKALAAVVVMQISFAWMILLIQAALNSGTKPSVFVVYRQILATLFLAPFAFFSTIKSKESPPPLTWRALFNIFMVSTLGIVISFNLNFTGLKYVSATVGTAMTNLIPTMVFIMAVCLRMEKVHITKWHGMSKVLGLMVSLGGAMAFIFYKGPPIFTKASHHHSHSLDHEKTYTQVDWIKGCFLCVGAGFTYSLLIILQGHLLKQCPGKLRLLTLQCGFSCIGSIVYAASVERNYRDWIDLLVAILGYREERSCFHFTFGPLSLLMSALFSAIFFTEILRWGSVLGGLLLIGGLYLYLWGKKREAQIEAQQKPDPSNVGTHLQAIVTSPPSDAEAAKVQSEGQQETDPSNVGTHLQTIVTSPPSDAQPAKIRSEGQQETDPSNEGRHL